LKEAKFDRLDSFIGDVRVFKAESNFIFYASTTVIEGANKTVVGVIDSENPSARIEHKEFFSEPVELTILGVKGSVVYFSVVMEKEIVLCQFDKEQGLEFKIDLGIPYKLFQRRAGSKKSTCFSSFLVVSKVHFVFGLSNGTLVLAKNHGQALSKRIPLPKFTFKKLSLTQRVKGRPIMNFDLINSSLFCFTGGSKVFVGQLIIKRYDRRQLMAKMKDKRTRFRLDDEIQVLEEFKAHSSRITAFMRYEKDYLITASETGSTRVWKLAISGTAIDHELLETISLFKRTMITCVAANAKYIVFGGNNGVIRVLIKEFNREQHKLVFRDFDTIEGGRPELTAIDLDEDNNIYSCAEKEFLHWPANYLMTAYDCNQILKIPEVSESSGKINKKTKVKKLHYFSDKEGVEEKILCYDEYGSGKGFVSLWVKVSDRKQAMKSLASKKSSMLGVDNYEDVLNDMKFWKCIQFFKLSTKEDGFSYSGDHQTIALMDMKNEKMVVYTRDKNIGRIVGSTTKPIFMKGKEIEDGVSEHSRQLKFITVNMDGTVIAGLNRAYYTVSLWKKNLSTGYEFELATSISLLDPMAQTQIENNKIYDMYFCHNSGTNGLLCIAKKDEFVKKSIPSDNGPEETVSVTPNSLFEDWKSQERCIFINKKNNIVLSSLYKSDNPEKMDIKIIVRINKEQEAGDQQTSSPPFSISQYVDIRGLDSNSKVHFDVREFESTFYLTVFINPRSEVSPFYKIYHFHPKKNRLNLTLTPECTPGLCFDEDLTFIAYGNPIKNHEICVKNNNYRPGKLPESLELHNYLIDIFEGNKNFINPQKFQNMNKYLKQNENAFNDLIVHKELKVPFLSVMSGCKYTLADSLQKFGYNRIFYNDGAQLKSKGNDSYVGSDPLLKAIDLNNQNLLNEFAKYCEEKPISNTTFSEDLFFKIMGSNSQRLKLVAVSLFLTPGQTEADLFIPESFPLSEEGFHCLQTENFERDSKFKKQYMGILDRNSSMRLKGIDFWTTSIPVDLRIGSEFTKNFLLNLQDCEDEVIVSDLKTVIRHMWITNRWMVICYSVFNWISILLFFWWIIWYQDNDWLFWVSFSTFMLLLLFEFISLIQGGMRYISSFWNWIDNAQYIAFPSLMIVMKYIRPDDPEDFWNEEKEWFNIIITFFMFLAFFRSITMLNFWDDTRYLIAMIVETFKDMRSFFTILIFSIYLFAMIHIEFSKTSTFVDDEGVESDQKMLGFLPSLDIMFNWCFGNWADSSAMNKAEYFGFLGFTIFLPLVMFNLFVALIWETFSNIKGNQEVADYRQILEILEDFNLFTSFFTGKSTKKNQKYLHLIVQSEDKDNVEEEKMKKLEGIEDVQEKIVDNLAQMQLKQTQIEEQLEVLEKTEIVHKKVIGAIKASARATAMMTGNNLQNFNINW
jgi:hypothetical protein